MLLFGRFMMWRKPTNNVDHRYFCWRNVKSFNAELKKGDANVNSVTNTIPQSPDILILLPFLISDVSSSEPSTHVTIRRKILNHIRINHNFSHKIQNSMTWQETWDFKRCCSTPWIYTAFETAISSWNPICLVQKKYKRISTSYFSKWIIRLL